MRRRTRQGVAYLLIMTLLFMTVPAQLHASTGDSAPIVIDNVVDSVADTWVLSIIGLSEGNTGIFYATSDDNWTTFQLRYKVLSTAGALLSDTNVSALMGARATNVSGFAAYAIADGQAVITWEGTNNGCGGAFQFVIVDDDGTVVKSATDISTAAATYNCYTGVKELSNGNIAFMWQNTGDEYLYRIFDAAGNAVTNPASVEKGGTRQDNFAHSSTYTHSLSANDQGQFLITYDINQNGNYIGAMYDNDGTRRLTNGVHHFYLGTKPLNGSNTSYNIGLPDGNFGVFFRTNSSLSMNIINNQGAVQSSISSGLIKDDHAGGALAIKGGGFLVYDTSTVGSSSYLYTKHYSADGTLLKDWTQRDTNPVIDQSLGVYYSPFIFSGYDSGFGFYNTVTNQLYLYDVGSSSTPSTPVAIVGHPSNATVNVGDTASFAVAATDVTSYQWQVNTGSGYSNITDGGLYSGATTDVLLITGTPLSMNGYMYRVIVNGSASSTATSSGANLTVNPLVHASTPSIGTQPANQTVYVNGTAPLSVTATISDSGSLSYQWYSNTTNSNSGGTLIGSAISASYSPPTGATGVIYYYVVVTNTNTSASGTKTATAVSNAISVTVKAPTTFTVSPEENVSFATLKEGYNTTDAIALNETITLTKVGTEAITNLAVSLSGGASTKFSIGTVNGDSLGAGIHSTSFIIRPKTGLTPGTHTETVTITADGGLSESFQVSFTVDPSTFTVSETGTVTFNSLIQGYTTTQVNGIKKSIILTKVGNGVINNLAVNFSGGATSKFMTGTVLPDTLGAGVNSAVLQVFPKAGLAPGTYTETVTITADGNISHSFQVSFTVISLVHAAMPVIGTQPASEAVDKGVDLTLSVGATISDNGTLNYQWFSNTSNSTNGGTPIVDANSATYEVPTDTAGTFYYYVGLININNNVNGTKIVSTFSDVAEVTVLQHAVAPSITSQPADEVVNVGDNESLSVGGTSNDGGTLSYQWYSNTVDSTIGGTLIGGATSATYAIPTNTSGIFYYYVVVTNTNNSVNGTKTASATSGVSKVTVLQHAVSPSITSQPADEVVNVGDSESLIVGATSNDGGTLSYQWYSNNVDSVIGGTLIDGATSATYTIPTSTAGTFYYYVVVTNMNNSVNGTKTASATSVVSEVTVQQHAVAPSITSQPADEVVNIGDSESLIVGATSNDGGILSYQWYSNTLDSVIGGTLIDGATSATYAIPTSTAGTFYYYVVVTNTNNSVNGTKTARATSVVSEVTINHTYEIEAIADLTATVLTQGYASSQAETVTITNSGTGALTNIVVAVSGSDAEHFVVTQPEQSLNAGATTSFTIRAKEGLVAATYSITVTISATNMTNESFDITQVVLLPEPPSEPQQVSTTPGNGKVTISWNAVDGATYYNVYRVTGEDQYTLIDTVTVLEYTVENLANGTEYGFVVKAGNPGGMSDYSSRVLEIPATVPGAPTNVIALAGDQQARITFTAPADNGGSQITGYEVIASPGNIVTTGSSSPITVNGLTNGVTYTFTVRAINSAGESDVSLPTYEVTPRATVYNKPAEENVEVIVNGKVQRAGVAKNQLIDGKLNTTITLDEAKIMERLATEGDQAVITIPFTSSSEVIITEINGQLMNALADKNTTIVIRTEHATYTLPSSEINIQALSAQLGANGNLKDVKIVIKIAKPSDETVKKVEDTITANGLAIVAAPLSFTISANYGNASIDINNFNSYVERTITIPEGIDPTQITTGIVIEADGSIRHIPTNIEKIDGQYIARINSLTNSVYAVIWNTVAYEDAATHWASESIHNMGARLIVYGVSEGQFAPELNITRAEFAAIIVRALGLKLEPSQGKFTDVEQGAWYSSVVQTAYAYGLINGFQDGTFGPEKSITREEAMVIISKAMLLTDLQGVAHGSSAESIVGAYKDGNQVASWAVVGVADAISAGIVSGKVDNSLAPQAAITRAEVAVIIERLLQNSDLINKEPVK